MQATSMYGPVHEELAHVEQRLRDMAAPQLPFLAQLLRHVFESPGKRLRPAITLLASKFHPHDGEEPEIMATAVELLHIATLIHDDTVDHSDFRRGKATVGSLWGRNAAVLVGDYIFAASATQVCETGNIRVIRRFAETIMELSSGELQEMAANYDYSQTKDQYLKRIYDKTASLFATAGEAGAVLTGAPEDVVQALKTYGYNLGMAFQIVDDILDFKGSAEEVGKPVGNDLSHGILTLPAMMAMERQPESNPIVELFQHPHDETSLRRSVDMIHTSPALDDSLSFAQDFCDKAAKSLQSLPQNPARDSLEELVDYVLTRRA